MGVVRLLTLTRVQYDILAATYPMDCKKVLENLLSHQEEVCGGVHVCVVVGGAGRVISFGQGQGGV